jgi:PHS family inorganic phosphate transporter-like MFS transporter
MARAEELSQQMLKIIDRHGFNWRVFLVAGSGFLASSYSLFATNVITPSLYYTYPPCGRLNANAGGAIDLLTLLGTIVGMLVVGHLADLYGRKKLYGLELVILIAATFGVVMSSEGYLVFNEDGTYRHSMDFYGWLAVWRFVLGIGIGAEVSSPLSCAI